MNSEDYGSAGLAWLALAACAPLPGSAASSPDPCAAEGALSYVCGASKPEDLALVPGTGWIVASGFSPGAGLKLIDARARSLETWFAARPEQLALDSRRFPDCDRPPDPSLFNARGISIREVRPGEGELYVVNHGGRESVEVFAIDYRQPASKPKLAWLGCLMFPAGYVGNSVATYGDGTVLVTILTRPSTTITDFVLGQKTGMVMERAPGEPRFRALEGTELEGNNGLETSREDDGFYVVAFGTRRIVKFDRNDTSRPAWSVTAPEFMPDNIHWHGDRLLAAGMVRDEPACGGVRQIVGAVANGMTCHRGYVVALLDPRSRSWSVVAYAEPSASFNGVSSALIAGDRLWLGSYQADRLAFRRLPTPIPIKNEPVR